MINPRGAPIGIRGRLTLAPVMKALAPHWGALLALALFLIAGLVVLDDYGLTTDEPIQRRTIQPHLTYVLDGDLDSFRNALPFDPGRFYSIAFESWGLFVERAFGLDDTRTIYLARHLSIHLAFLTGGLFAYLLARRLFDGQVLGLLAMTIFLLHPRIYAHSFFNSKDIPFLAMFMIALFLTHRAFKRDNASAFVLLGVGVGALVNLRIMGVVLLAGIPALRALDLAFAQGWAERKRVLLTTGAFTLASALTIYALLPYLWGDPIGRAVEWWSTLSSHPYIELELFRGTIRRSVDFPVEYLPVWFSITAPPFALLLGLIGILVVVARGIEASKGFLRGKGKQSRFALLLAGCFVAPALWVVVAGPNIYNGWRQLYFLWAPFALLAAFGLQWLVAVLRRARLSAAVYAAIGAGLIAAVASMALIHPNQQVYFNVLVDRVTPERLRTQYVMDYWNHPARQALERLLAETPSSPVKATMSGLGGMLRINARILPEAERERLAHAPGPDALAFASGPAADEDLTVHAVSLYGNTLISVARKPDLEAAYAAASSGEPVIRSEFDVHYANGALVYVKEPCGEADVAGGEFKLSVVPWDEADLPREWEFFRREDRSFHFLNLSAVVDGKCVASVPLPNYPVAAVRTGQSLPGSPETDGREVPLWESEVLLNLELWREARRDALSREPLARAVFDLRIVDGALVYLKEPCGEADTETRFFLHVVPEREGDLPRERRARGFDNLGFDFFLRGGRFDGACLARVPLPDYPVASIRTGQFVSGAGEIWSVEFEVGAASAENGGGA